MKKLLILLCAFATLPIGAIEYKPGAFRALQGVGLGLDGARLITSLSQWGTETAVVRLQKQVARLEAALEKRKDSLTPRALKRATLKLTNAKKRLASRIKGLSANHRFTMGLTAASEAAHVRNNIAEKGLGIVGAILATAQLPQTRIGKHAWLKGLLGATDAGLGIARGLYYKNPRQMALFTAAQRATRLLHLLATYGAPGKNKRMIATYIAQALGLAAAGMGDPRENKTKNFNWQGVCHTDMAGLRNPGQFQQEVLAQLADPTLSIDRRNAMSHNAEQLREEFGLHQDRINVINILPFSNPLKARLRQHFQSHPPDETDLKGAMMLKDDHGSYLIEQVAPRGQRDWHRVYTEQSEQLDTRHVLFVSQLANKYPGQTMFTAEQLLAVHNDAINREEVEQAVHRDLAKPLNEALVRMKIQQRERELLSQKRDGVSRDFYGKPLVDLEKDEQIMAVMGVKLTKQEKQNAETEARRELVAAQQPTPNQISQHVEERVRARQRTNEAFMMNMVHEAMIRDLGSHADAGQIRARSWSDAGVKGYTFTFKRLKQDNDERKERATVEALVEEFSDNDQLRRAALEKLIESKIADWLHAGTIEAEADFKTMIHQFVSRKAVDLPGISDGQLNEREKQRKIDKDELCPNCHKNFIKGGDIVSLGCQQCGTLLHADCFDNASPASCPTCRNDAITPRLIGGINPSGWAKKLFVLSADKQPGMTDAEGAPNRALDETQALWQVAERMFAPYILQQIRNSEYPQHQLVNRLREVIGTADF